MLFRLVIVRAVKMGTVPGRDRTLILRRRLLSGLEIGVFLGYFGRGEKSIGARPRVTVQCTLLRGAFLGVIPVLGTSNLLFNIWLLTKEKPWLFFSGAVSDTPEQFDNSSVCFSFISRLGTRDLGPGTGHYHLVLPEYNFIIFLFRHCFVRPSQLLDQAYC